MSKLNILNLAFSDEGGAGIASLYFNELFNEAGHNSMLIVGQSKLKNENVTIVENYSSNYSLNFIRLKFKNQLNLRRRRLISGDLEPKYNFVNVEEHKQYISSKEILKNTPFKPDIIILHWVSNFFNSKSIKELQEQTKAKVFWIMMDNAPLTGGCHYPWDCKEFERNCNNCPAILQEKRKGIAENNLKFKIKNLPDNVELITCSESDYQRALQSTIFKTKTVHKILFPLDENKFKPVNKKEAKRYWEINANSKVLFYGSISLVDKRKGSSIFLMALKEFQRKYEEEGHDCSHIIILIAGNNYLEVFKDLKFQIKMIGYLNEEDLIRAYQAADVFVSSSLEDSGPLMVNQSIMCGTPVVSFDIGVAIDLVQEGKTGYKARLGDSEDLANGIKYLLDLDDNEHLKMSDNCRALGLQLCNSQKQMNRYIEIFNMNV